MKLKNPPHHCADTALDLYFTRLQDNRMKFSTKNLARRETGWYVTVVQMVWLIAQKRQDSFPTHAVIGRRDQPNLGPWVCDGLIQTHTVMKQHCMGGS